MPKSKKVSVKPLAEFVAKAIEPELTKEVSKSVDIPVFEESYPFWKVIVWRYARVFMAGFLAAIPIDLLLTGETNYIVTTLKAALAGGIAALALALREDRDKDAVISKLPF